VDPGFELRHRHIRRGMFLFNGARSNWRQVRRLAASIRAAAWGSV